METITSTSVSARQRRTNQERAGREAETGLGAAGGAQSGGRGVGPDGEGGVWGWCCIAASD